MSEGYQAGLLRWAMDSIDSAARSDNPVEWLTPPRDAALRKGVVDIWRIPLRPADDPAAKRRSAHAALRIILGRYLGQAPDALRIEREPDGKPRLADLTTPMEFNLSHCRDLALVAVCAGPAVGIDVERERLIDNPLRLARRALPDDAVALLRALEPADRAACFLRLWTCFEARQKSMGRGIFAAAVAPSAVRSRPFRPGPAHYACIATAAPGGDPTLRFLDFLADTPLQ